MGNEPLPRKHLDASSNILIEHFAIQHQRSAQHFEFVIQAPHSKHSLNNVIRNALSAGTHCFCFAYNGDDSVAYVACIPSNKQWAFWIRFQILHILPIGWSVAILPVMRKAESLLYCYIFWNKKIFSWCNHIVKFWNTSSSLKLRLRQEETTKKYSTLYDSESMPVVIRTNLGVRGKSTDR